MWILDQQSQRQGGAQVFTARALHAAIEQISGYLCQQIGADKGFELFTGTPIGKRRFDGCQGRQDMGKGFDQIADLPGFRK